MRYQKTVIEGFTAELPPNRLPSEEVESLLAPAYDRLNLSPGRLELFTGIKERRFWKPGTRPSEVAARAGRKLMNELNLDSGDFDLLIHCSVCRDFLEPATASVVHSLLDMPASCQNYDISNACLGIMSGITVASALVECGAIRRALLVSGEIGYPLLLQTIDHLNNKKDLTRQSFKPHFASLTIGSCAAAVCVSSADLASDGHRLISTTDYSNTRENHLCQGDHQQGGGDGPLMETDSEELLVRGVETAGAAWKKFISDSDWSAEEIDKCCTHQVGTSHSNLLFKTIGLERSLDYLTFPVLGNCGSASLPATVALAAENNHFQKNDKVALLGIGSGINCCLSSLIWNKE